MVAAPEISRTLENTGQLELKVLKTLVKFYGSFMCLLSCSKMQKDLEGKKRKQNVSEGKKAL